MGCDHPTQHWGWPLSPPRVDGGVPKGSEVHRLRPFLSPSRQKSSGANSRKRECHCSSGQNHPWQNLCALILCRGCQQLLWRVHDCGSICRQRHYQSALWVQRQRRVQTCSPQVCGCWTKNKSHVPQHFLHYEKWWLLFTLWTCGWWCQVGKPA